MQVNHRVHVANSRVPVGGGGVVGAFAASTSAADFGSIVQVPLSQVWLARLRVGKGPASQVQQC